MLLPWNRPARRPAPSRVAPTIVAPEAKSLAAPTPDLLEIFGAIPSASGITVSTETALKVPAVACAISTIANAAGSLDRAVKRREADGTESDVPDHPVSEMLRGDVNDWTSAAELVGDLVADALISDSGGVAHVSRTADGRIVEVVRYRRGTVTVDRHPVTD
jgi:phage portal protein BeeE